MALLKQEVRSFFGQCKCCLNYAYLKNMWKMEMSEEDEDPYGKMLVDCFSISWTVEDEPDNDKMCDMCILRLRDAVSFKKLVLQSQHELYQESTDKLGIHTEKLDLQIEYSNEEKSQSDDSDSELKERTFEDVQFLEEEFLVEEGAEGDESLDSQPETKKRKWPKHLPKRMQNKTYRQYTEDQLKDALEEVKSNKASIRQASVKHGVPRRTLTTKTREPNIDDGENQGENIHQEGNTISLNIDNIKLIEITSPKAKRILKESRRSHVIEEEVFESESDDQNQKEVTDKHRDDKLRSLQIENPEGKTFLKESKLVNEPRQNTTDKERNHQDDNINTKHSDNNIKYISNTTPVLKESYLVIGEDVSEIIENELINQESNTVSQHNIQSTQGTSNAIPILNISHLVIGIREATDNASHEEENIISERKGIRSTSLGTNAMILNKSYVINKGIQETLEVKRNIQVDNAISKHRDNIRSILAASNATPIRGYWGIGYACSFCPQQFAVPFDLKQHTFQHEHIEETYKMKSIVDHNVKLDVTALKCNKCEENIESLEKLMAHLKLTHQMPMHFDVRSHIVPFSFDNDVLKCVKCSKLYGNFKNLSDHMNDHHFRNYECKECGRGFVNIRSLKTHSIRHRKGVFACTFCAKVFETKIKMTDHERVVHILENKTRKCSYCDEKFTDVVQRTKHEFEIHGTAKPEHRCNACPKLFESKPGLLTHVNEVHLLRKPYECRECERAFYKKMELNMHALRHHTGEHKPLQCSVCLKRYSNRNTLTNHMLTHEDLVKHACEICGHSFEKEFSYLAHMKNNHGLE